MSKSELRICQIENPDIYLPCKEEVDGLRCERIERHSEDHWLGEHTILHRIAGSETTCDGVDGVSEPTTPSPILAPAPPPVSKPKNVSKPITNLRLAGMVAAAVALAVTLALVVQFGIPKLTTPDVLTRKDGNITALNTGLAAFTGQTIASANVKQKALAIGERAVTPPAFIFSNGEENVGRKDLHIYVDFGDQGSRDFFLLNATLLRSLVEGGKVNLYLHAVPNGEAYSLLAPETLAESFYYSPEKAWASLLAILKFADEYQSSNYNTGKLAKRLADVVTDNGVEDIDKESIQNGTFGSWLLSIASDPTLGMGTRVPAAYLGKQELDLSNLDLTVNRRFLEALETN